MTFCFDENLPPRVAEALRALGTEVYHVVEYLGRGTPDEQVFAFLAERGWHLVTQDARIHRNPHQRRALLQAGIGAFILTGRTSRTISETMIFLLQHLPAMQQAATERERPFIITVSDRGRITVMRD